MKSLFFWILLGIVGSFLSLFCLRQTDGFQLIKVLSSLPAEKQWELPPLSQEEKDQLCAYLKQPFYYLGKGGQCHAFLSEDEKIVLKLFKMSNLYQYPWAHSLALPAPLAQLRDKLLLTQREKLLRTFGSSHLAYSQLKEESGLLFLNLNPNPALKSLHVTLVDKLGIVHRVALDHLPFALQVRAESALETIETYLKEGKMDEAKELFRHAVLLLKKRHSKGIGDRDLSFGRNLGVASERALFIDIGNFFLLDSPSSGQEFLPLRLWAQKRSQELVSYLDELISEEACEGS